jgi:Tfp pilus assembly protein PilZ
MNRDRRNTNRVTVAIHPARVNVMDDDGPIDLRELGVEIVELSHEGARLRIRGTLEAGDRLALDFSYRNRAFTIPGRIVWSKPAPDDGDGAHEVGVHFEDIPPLTQARLASVLGRHLELNGPGAGSAAS